MITEVAMPPTLLVVDDDRRVVDTIERLSVEMGFDVVGVGDIPSALDFLRTRHPHGVIVDASGVDGARVLREFKDVDPQIQVILITDAGTIGSAVQAIKAGALDYVSLPLDVERFRDLLVTVRKSVERREMLLRIDADVAPDAHRKP